MTDGVSPDLPTPPVQTEQTQGQSIEKTQGQEVVPSTPQLQKNKENRSAIERLIKHFGGTPPDKPTPST